MKKQNHSIETLKQAIENLNDLLIISHVLPDGDNVGSVIAMALWLESAGKRVTAVINGEMPPYYRFLEGADRLVPPDAVEHRPYEGVLCLDMSDKERGGRVWERVGGEPTLINIDHHVSNEGFGDYNFVWSDASSTAEIVTFLLTEWGVPLTRAIAEALYTGIVTDSGSFTYPSTSPRTMRMAALLLEEKPRLEAIRENVLENVTFKRKKLLAAVLERAELSCGGRLCHAAIDHDAIAALGATGPDFENIIDHLIGITGVEYAVFFREMEKGRVKVGFRGRGGNDVTVAASRFGGGGHKAAAGCSFTGSLEDAVKEILAVVRAGLEAN
ncbi:MAG: DHH family phosphoesterase [Bacillota bacterium]|jgi:phosphoesterase RecJ-like protein